MSSGLITTKEEGLLLFSGETVLWVRHEDGFLQIIGCGVETHFCEEQKRVFKSRRP